MYDISKWESLVMDINRQIMKYEGLCGDHTQSIRELKEDRQTALEAISKLKKHL